MATNTATAQEQNTNPLFYSNPTLLQNNVHTKVQVASDIGFGFAAQTTAVPLNLIEFPQAAHYYPIAFARDENATPVAIVGIRDGENLFINKKGEWRDGSYIPAYVRRYPFILSTSESSDQLSLCADDVPGVMDKAGSRLFEDDGTPTEFAKNALEFCRSYHQAATITQGFGKALHDAGVLVDRTAEITLEDGSRVSFSGFRIVDEEKFNKLPEKTFMEWRDKGYLAGVYAHLFSGLHWGTLTRLVNERGAKK